MTISCFIRDEIDPFQREAFRACAEAGGRIIPRCGGHLRGYPSARRPAAAGAPA